MYDGEERDKDVHHEEERHQFLASKQRLDQIRAQRNNNDIVHHTIPVVLDERVGEKADA